MNSELYAKSELSKQTEGFYYDYADILNQKDVKAEQPIQQAGTICAFRTPTPAIHSWRIKFIDENTVYGL